MVHLRLPTMGQISSSHEPSFDTTDLPAFYICALQLVNGTHQWIHQGYEPGLKLRTYQKILPLWLQISLILFLLSLSAIFSGLNLGTYF